MGYQTANGSLQMLFQTVLAPFCLPLCSLEFKVTVPVELLMVLDPTMWLFTFALQRSIEMDLTQFGSYESWFNCSFDRGIVQHVPADMFNTCRWTQVRMLIPYMFFRRMPFVGFWAEQNVTFDVPKISMDIGVEEQKDEFVPLISLKKMDGT